MAPGGQTASALRAAFGKGQVMRKGIRAVDTATMQPTLFENRDRDGADGADGAGATAPIVPPRSLWMEEFAR